MSSIPKESYLVQRFGNEAEEVPESIGIFHVRLRVALLGVDEVGKLQRVADEEDRRVVAHHIPVTFLGVELEGESPGVSRSIRIPRLPCNGRESGEHRRLLADFTEETRLAKIRYVTARVHNQHHPTHQHPTHLI